VKNTNFLTIEDMIELFPKKAELLKAWNDIYGPNAEVIDKIKMGELISFARKRKEKKTALRE
jgi:hypothetical protein